MKFEMTISEIGTLQLYAESNGCNIIITESQMSDSEKPYLCSIYKDRKCVIELYVPTIKAGILELLNVLFWGE